MPFDKSKTVSFVFLIVKNSCFIPPQSRFPVKLIYSIDFGSATNFCCLLTFVAIIS